MIQAFILWEVVIIGLNDHGDDYDMMSVQLKDIKPLFIYQCSVRGLPSRYFFATGLFFCTLPAIKSATQRRLPISMTVGLIALTRREANNFLASYRGRHFVVVPDVSSHNVCLQRKRL